MSTAFASSRPCLKPSTVYHVHLPIIMSGLVGYGSSDEEEVRPVGDSALGV